MSTKRTHTTKARVKNDYYPTPLKLVDAFIKQYGQEFFSSEDRILDPCCGDKIFSQALSANGYTNVGNTDLVDPYGVEDPEFDATTESYWSDMMADWVFTNPPFNISTSILRHALKSTRKGVIFLLRSTYDEPVTDRRTELIGSLSEKIVTNPRCRFRSDTKNSDSATVAFFIWDHRSSRDYAKLRFLVDWNK